MKDLKEIRDEPNKKFDAWGSLNKTLKPTSIGTLGSSHYMASIFNEQCSTTSTIDD